ncbi:pyrroline-5-carboxylate reductase 2 isoform X2 [Cherax quadricarinatus]|uniref:pyrroline-5-carboxylate reductase 2 isoform X2 n=1 Tax=Cherax quadricarinatus TaxID=27406 RepID=UPI00387EB802
MVLNKHQTQLKQTENVPAEGTVTDTGTVFSDSVHESILIPANVGFVGCGNMAQALLHSFIKKDKVIKQCDVIFLCVKPHLLRKMINELNTLEADHSPLFVSIVSGYDLNTLEEMLSVLVHAPRVVRTMPNTPSMVGQGCCLYTLGTHTSPADSVAMNSILSSVGFCAEIPEYQMDAACGLAGSGPAYIYAAIEALADGGVKMGLPRQLAQTLAAQTVKGAATMVLEHGKHPAQLKDEVCSPGGTTIAAMHSLEKNGFRNALISAVEAAALRSIELGSDK